MTRDSESVSCKLISIDRSQSQSIIIVDDQFLTINTCELQTSYENQTRLRRVHAQLIVAIFFFVGNVTLDETTCHS